MKQTKKLLAAFFLAVLTISIVSAFGVSYPQPQNIELKPGQSSYFSFQIQTDDFPVTCVPVIESIQGLELAFEQSYNVLARERYNVKPQVIVPKQTGFGSYTAKFCIECSPSSEVDGSKIIPRVCNLPVTVNVVAERTGQNMFEAEEAGAYVIWITLLSIAIILLAMVIFYIVKKRNSV